MYPQVNFLFVCTHKDKQQGLADEQASLGLFHTATPLLSDIKPLLQPYRRKKVTKVLNTKPMDRPLEEAPQTPEKKKKWTKENQ